MREHEGFLRRLERALSQMSARVRSSIEDLRRDYDVPPPPTALTRAELRAFRRQLHTTSRLMRDLSNLDSPSWNEVNEEYDRSWVEMERARSGGPSPSAWSRGCGTPRRS